MADLPATRISAPDPMARVCQRCDYENAEEAKFCLQCGAMLEVEAEDGGDPLIGKILLHRYRVVKVLGEGGMGKVYLAEQKMGTATRNVAIKTLHPELSGDPQLVARFHRECETVIELHHPNTVQFYDFGDLEDKTLFIVMEFIEGEDLAHRLQRGAVPPEVADKLIIQICGSLAEAHQRGVVHRDLKPENVLLTSRGGQEDFVKVLDFGIAKRSEAEDESRAKLTKQGMVLGTPPYMSPEQFSGQTLDARSDIYSLGVMTYEMLTGTLPFEAKTPWEWATKHLTQQPTPLDHHPVGAQLPPNKKNAIMRALAKNREERHPDVLAFMHEFTGIGDAQAAWTMATATGGGASTTGAAGTPRTPVGTPQPMHASQPGLHPANTPPPGQAFPTPTPTPTPAPNSSPAFPAAGPMGQNPTPTPMDMGQFPSGAMPVQQGGGAGKWIALLLVVFVVLGGAVGGGLYWYSQQDDPGEPVAVNSQNGTGQNGTGDTGNDTGNTGTNQLNVTKMQPLNGASMDATTMDTTAMAEMVEVPTMVETPTMEQATMEQATMEEPTMEEPTMEEPSMRSTMRSTSDADRAQPFLRSAQAALNANNLSSAISGLRNAQRIVGRNHRSVRSVKNAIAQRGSNQVGIYIVQNRCSQAQGLYRQLRTVGAHRQAGEQFYGGPPLGPALRSGPEAGFLGGIARRGRRDLAPARGASRQSHPSGSPNRPPVKSTFCPPSRAPSTGSGAFGTVAPVVTEWWCP